VTKEPKTNMNEIHMIAYNKFVNIDRNDYFAIINSGHGLFQNVEKKLPDFVVQRLREWLTEDLVGNNEAIHTPVRKKKGEKIWQTFTDARHEVNNLANPRVRECKSGENMTGILLEVRERMFIEDRSRIRKDELSTKASDTVGKGMNDST